jgi:hypothetical protein
MKQNFFANNQMLFLIAVYNNLKLYKIQLHVSCIHEWKENSTLFLTQFAKINSSDVSGENVW